jgi:hypothetical protein
MAASILGPFQSDGIGRALFLSIRQSKILDKGSDYAYPCKGFIRTSLLHDFSRQKRTREEK